MSASFSLARTCLLVLLGSAAICPGVNAAPPASASSASAREVATKAKLGAVRAEITKIADAQHATAAKRDAINARLAAQATQLNQAANAVRESDAAIAAKAASLVDLGQQRATLEQKLSGQRAALADLLRAVYTLNRGTDLAMLLGDDDIAKIDRALVGEVAQLDKVKASIETETTALKQQRDQRAAQAVELEQARDAQQQLLAQATARIAQ